MRFDTLSEWLNWQESFHPKTIDLGLARVRRVFDRLRQSSGLPYTITVAGTNGKGSSVAFLDAILRASGYRVGVYSSPHILRYNERIRIDGTPVEDSVICQAFERIEHVRGETSLSYFEFGTLAALDIFSRSNIDIQVLEVGLGGRLDAVNIVDADVVLITSIGIDHSDWLGESREAIGYEKAGVFRAGVPAVIGDPDPPQSLAEYAQRIGTPLALIGKTFGFEKSESTWSWRNPSRCIKNLPIPALAGEQQFLNAAAVLQVLALLEPRFPVSREALCNGLAAVHLVGRYQLIAGAVPVLLDVAHNPQAAMMLADYLRARFSRYRIRVVFSIMRDKDIRGVLMPLRDLVRHWYLAPLDMARAADEPMLVAAFRDCGIADYACGFDGFESAYRAARESADENDLIVIFGSFHLVSAYLAGKANL